MDVISPALLKLSLGFRFTWIEIPFTENFSLNNLFVLEIDIALFALASLSVHVSSTAFLVLQAYVCSVNPSNSHSRIVPK